MYGLLGLGLGRVGVGLGLGFTEFRTGISMSPPALHNVTHNSYISQI